MRAVNVIVLCAFYIFSGVLASDKVFMCYYGSWATYRHGLGKFEVSNIDTNICTHLIYTFVGINNNGVVISLDPYLDLPDNSGRDYFGQFNALKNQNPSLKTILAVGGWNEGSAKYSIMAADPVLRKNFIDSALSMVLDHGFDGFDLDWEYPNRRDSVHGEADVDNFSVLCKELKEAFAPHGLLLTSAVSAVEQTASFSYDIPVISQYFDYINLMTYDFYGAWDHTTGLNAPLYYSGTYSIEKAVDYWLDEGFPSEKLILGLPLYGRTFQLSDPKNNAVGAPSDGAGIAGPYTATSGTLGYNELCEMMQTESWTYVWDNASMVPYTVRGRDWVSYDNPESLYLKTKYAMDRNLGGVMVWSIETDDFHALCHDEVNPLLNTIRRTLNGAGFTTPAPSSTIPSSTNPSSSNPSSTTPSSTNPSSTNPSSTTPTSTNPSSPTSTSTDATSTSTHPSSTQSTIICKQEGFTSNPEDCKSFYMCVRNTDDSFKAFLFTCPGELYWDQNNSNCNYPEDVYCSL